MTDTRPTASPARGGIHPALVASRAQWGLVALLFTLAGVAWWWTVELMRGMDNGPWTDLGTFGWFVSVWVVMMAAMMFPSVAPTIALYAKMSGSSRLMPWIFTGGYLLTWAGAGVVAFLIGAGAHRLANGDLSWDRAGRPIAGAVLVLAAGYELTPLKNVCLGKCRSPLGTLLASWRGGWSGALRMGVKNGAWCVGCCWALMASLFALGVMSVVWMAVVAGFIAVEKILPWRRTATYGTALVLLALGLLVLVAPDALPGLTVPGDDSMSVMSPMVMSFGQPWLLQ
jgi:predicted metal-binding membrane protein